MKELFLLKLGEIVLKGQNRRVFEDKLKTVTRRVGGLRHDLRRGPDVPLPCLRKKSRRHV